jgi:hypothetical protein
VDCQDAVAHHRLVGLAVLSLPRDIIDRCAARWAPLGAL